jgi:hypothetical protein
MRFLPFVFAFVSLPTVAAPTTQPDVKPPCRGLMPRDLPSKQTWDFLDSVVVQVNWKDLEPAEGKYDGPAWEKIERARKEGYKIRLRILCGIHSPAYVKKLGGPGISDAEHHLDASQTGCVAVWNPHDQKGGVIPRFWLPEVLDRYEALMTEVARRYEDAPEIREVVDSACMTVYAEPFYRAHADAGTNARLFEAGLTFEKDKAAHERAIEIHEKLFKKTRTSLAINSWDVIDDSPSHHHATFSPTYDFAGWAREKLGQRLVLQNNGTGVDAHVGPKDTPQTNHFAYLSEVTGPKGFQTRTLQRLGGNADGLFRTLDIALSFGANFVELPSGYQKFDPEKLREYDQKLEAANMTGIR